MRQPFWRWTGWLCLGLAGCLRGNVHQSQVRVGPNVRDGSRQIVPVSGQQAHARLLAATAAGKTATSDNSATFRVAVPGPTMGSTRSTSAGCPTCSAGVCVSPKSADGIAGEFVPVAVPADELPMTISPYDPSVALRPDEPRPFVAKASAIPISQSVSTRISYKPSLDDDFFPDDHEPSAKFPVRQVSNQNPADSPPLDQPEDTTESRRPAKQETPDVVQQQLTDTLPKGSAAQPRDVALLVDQVFEDLRQRRLADARQRTEWLKQLVARRSATPEAFEPRMLDDIKAATPIEPVEVEDFFEERDARSLENQGLHTN